MSAILSIAYKRPVSLQAAFLWAFSAQIKKGVESISIVSV